MPLQQKKSADTLEQKQLGTMIRFAFAGGFASAVYYVVGNALAIWCVLPVMSINGLAYACGMVASYVSQKIWVFRDISSHRRAIPLFLMSSFLGLGLNSLVVWVLIGMRVRYSLASLAAIVAVAVVSYCTQRFIVFNKRQ